MTVFNHSDRLYCEATTLKRIQYDIDSDQSRLYQGSNLAAL